jgi:hypothetical protein
MNIKIAYFLFSIFISIFCFECTLEARNLKFTYTAPAFVSPLGSDKKDIIIEFTVDRDFKNQGKTILYKVNETKSLDIVDDGPSLFRIYLISIRVSRVADRDPFPFFLPAATGLVTISVDGAAADEVIMEIDPLEGLNVGPSAYGIIF